MNQLIDELSADGITDAVNSVAKILYTEGVSERVQHGVIVLRQVFKTALEQTTMIPIIIRDSIIEDAMSGNFDAVRTKLTGGCSPEWLKAVVMFARLNKRIGGINA